MNRTLSTLIVILAASLPASVGSAATVRTIALAGQAAPGTQPGVVFNEFGSPVLNNAGQVAFLGTLGGDGVVLTGPGVFVGNSRGMWSEGTGTLSLVAREGDLAPGLAPGTDAVFRSFNTPRINDTGQTVLGATLFGGTVGGLNTLGIWSEAGGASGGLSLVVHERTQAPGTPAGTNFFIPATASAVINSAGRVTFSSSLADGPGLDSGNDDGIWSQDAANNLQLRMRSGEQAPGLDAGVVFTGRNGIAYNDSQNFAFRGFLAGTGVTGANDVGIWTATANGLTLLAREGDLAPGTDVGETFNQFSVAGTSILGFNNAGQVAFRATLNGATAATDGGVWAERGGNLSLVAREGDAAPGLAGVNFSGFLDPRINGAGQTAFVAQTTNFRTGIWSEGAGQLSLVASQGDQAPGLDLGVVFNSFSNLLGTTEFILNAQGQMAFVANLVGTGVTGSNNSALFVQIDDVLTSVAREGDSFEVAQGDVRTISLINILDNTGNEDGLPSSFNDAGQLAFRLSFTDGSQGIFVLNTVVPEPSSITIVSLAALTLCLGRPRNLHWLAPCR